MRPTPPPAYPAALPISRSALVRIGLALMLVFAIAAPTGAGHEPGEVPSYTGCLNRAGGLSNLAEGDTPQAPCPPGQAEIHLSGGDITDITAGAGLAGGTGSGSALLSLAPSYQLPQACVEAEVAKWDGAAWVCDVDNDTTYTAGTGISLSGSEFSVDTGQVQTRVTGTCDDGGSIRAIADDGTVTCQEVAVGSGSFEGAACAAFAPGSGVIVANYDEFGFLTGTRCEPTTPDALEPNDTREQATDLRRFTVFQSHEVDANIVPAGNDDWYETNTTCATIIGTMCKVNIELSGPAVAMQVFIGDELVEPDINGNVITGSSFGGVTNGVLEPVTVHIRIFSAEQRPYHLRISG